MLSKEKMAPGIDEHKILCCSVFVLKKHKIHTVPHIGVFFESVLPAGVEQWQALYLVFTAEVGRRLRASY